MKLKILALILIILILLLGLVYYFVLQKQKTTVPAWREEKKETLAEKQLKELDELRQKAGSQPLTEKDKKAQIKDLGILREQSGAKPLSQTEIQKPARDGRGSLNEIERQLEELDELRSAR